MPTHRPPTHPGEMLLEEFLNPMSLTQRELVDAIHIPYQHINDIVNGSRSVTPSTASCDFILRLANNSISDPMLDLSRTQRIPLVREWICCIRTFDNSR